MPSSPATRPGFATTEFWLVIAANVLVNVGAIDVGGGKYRGLLAIISVVGYALSRGLAKVGDTFTPLASGEALSDGETDGLSQGVKAQGWEPPDAAGFTGETP
jgi:hypothetical protein